MVSYGVRGDATSFSDGRMGVIIELDVIIGQETSCRTTAIEEDVVFRWLISQELEFQLVT